MKRQARKVLRVSLYAELHLLQMIENLHCLTMDIADRKVQTQKMLASLI